MTFDVKVLEVVATLVALIFLVGFGSVLAAVAIRLVVTIWRNE